MIKNMKINRDGHYLYEYHYGIFKGKGMINYIDMTIKIDQIRGPEGNIQFNIKNGQFIGKAAAEVYFRNLNKFVEANNLTPIK